MTPFFLLLFVTLLLFFIQGAFSFSNFFFHRVLQSISLFLLWREPFEIVSNISIFIKTLKAIFKYIKTLRFVRGIINIFNKGSNFIGTLKDNKIFYVFYIKKIIMSLSIRYQGFIIITPTLERKVFKHQAATRFITAKRFIIIRA